MAMETILTGLRWRYPEKYTDADPYKYIVVDPASIDQTSGEHFSKRRGWVVGGDWDKKGEPFMQRTFPKAIQQRFVEGKDWEDTPLYDFYDERDWYTRFEQRAKSIDHLYRRIRENGYKSQRQLLEDDPDAAWDGLNDAMHPVANEIAVDIGRNGELLWNMCGQHRLAIAKILDVDQIRVQVFRRHTEWQRIRNQVRQGADIPEGIRDHPDLQCISGGN